jgi:hypothetical protein
MLSVREEVAGRVRTGADGAHNPGCFRLHHGHHDGAETTGLEPATSRLTSECSFAAELRLRRRRRWKAGSAPRNRRQRRRRRSSPEPAVAHRRSCQRVSAPPPPHRLALEACRSQLHVRARALHQPLFRHFLGPPVGGPILSSAGGIRTHGLELMRLARTAAPPPRKSDRQESNLRSPVPETCGVASSPTARRRSKLRRASNRRRRRLSGSGPVEAFGGTGRFPATPAAGLEPASRE